MTGGVVVGGDVAGGEVPTGVEGDGVVGGVDIGEVREGGEEDGIGDTVKPLEEGDLGCRVIRAGANLAGVEVVRLRLGVSWGDKEAMGRGADGSSSARRLCDRCKCLSCTSSAKGMI